MKRIPELDTLRGLAAACVVLHHALEVPYVGWTVDLFFVLSGYLITAIILEHGGARGFLLAFYARRGLRIWPIYYLTLLATVVLGRLLEPSCRLDGLPYFLAYLQYTPMYWGRSQPPVDLPIWHTWTLAVEEQFYLLWPALLCLVGRGRTVPLAAALVAASVVARGFAVSSWVLLGHFDGLALGAILAALLRDGRRVGRHEAGYRRGFALLGLAGLALLGVGHVAFNVLGTAKPAWWPASNLLLLNVAFSGLVGLVVLHAGRPALRPLRARALCYVGLISYGFYLYHVPIVWLKDHLVAALGPHHAAWLTPLTVPASLAAAALSWEFVERPILALKDRFPYGPRPARAAPAAGPEAVVREPLAPHARPAHAEVEGAG